MLIKVIECKNLDDCYDKKTSDSLTNELIDELDQKELIKQRLIIDKQEEESGTTRIVTMPNRIKNSLKAGQLISSNDEDDNDDGKQQLTPQNYDEIETLDNGLTWSVKTRFQIKQFKLIFCIARNEIGDSISSKIVIPIDLDNGKTHQVKIYNERNQDNEIVQGDTFFAQFAFSNVLYEPNNYTLKTKPDGCALNSNDLKIVESDSRYNFTKIVSLKFTNVTSQCNFNYSLQLHVKNHPNFVPTEPPYHKPKNPSLEYSLKVLEPIKPYFIDSITNQTIAIDDGSSDNITILMTTSDIKVDSDKTIELNCQSNGRPKPIVVWFKDSKLLNLTDEKYKLSDGSLKIFRTHPVDSGDYECHVSNRYGALTRSFNVEVESTSLTIKVKELTKVQLIIIIISSVASFILAILLAIALIYGIKKTRENNKLKRKHKKLIQFLNDGKDFDGDFDEDALINTKLENIERIKFDDKKWEIEPTNFVIFSGNLFYIFL